MFKPLNEVRKLKKGEWFFNKSFPCMFQWDKDEESDNIRPIYEQIEIPVPEGAKDFNYAFDLDYHLICHIPLSKPKVKKWLWKCRIATTEMRYSEEELNDAGYILGNDAWHKVEGSEAEE